MPSLVGLRWAICPSALVLALGTGGEARAQQAAASGDAAEAIQEVVVTSQKRTERLLDVPMSISAVSAEQLVQAGITSTGDLQQVTPGLVTVNNGLAFTPAVRGISSVGTSPGDETNVAVYLDDVYLGAPLANLFELQDIERVEVLKGPQGTLFGRNATGGAIRIVTAAPSFSPKGEVSASYGFDYHQTKLGAYVTGPLSETVAGSLSASYVHDDGYAVTVAPPNIGTRVAQTDKRAFRGKLLFKPSEDLRFTFTADASEKEDNAVFTGIPRNGRNVNESVPGTITGSPGHYPGSTLPIINVSTAGAGIDTVWDPSDKFSMHAVTAYRNDRGLYQTDVDRVSVSNNALRLVQKQETFSQEFDFTGRWREGLNWLGGLYYYHSSAGNPYFSSYSGDAVGTPTASFTDTVTTNSAAAFGELTYDLTSRLHLTGGARYTWEKKSLDFADTIRALGLRTAHGEDTWTSPTFRGVVRYDITSDVNVYASASNGFKSGVFNAYALPAIPVRPEKITAYEVGAKARIHGVTVTAAAFNYDYQDIQVQGSTFIGSAWVVTLDNAARAKIRGFEVSANANVTEHLAVDAGISALPTARYDNFERAQVFIPNALTGGATNNTSYDASGSRVIRAPKWQGNFRLMYRNTLFGGELNATGSASYNSGFYWQAGNYTPQGAYTVVNARIAWTDPKDVVTYSLWGENLTDRLYSINTTSGVVGLADSFAPPRLIGMGVNVKF